MKDTMAEYHKPALLEECLELLKINPDGMYVDVTYGGGGHSREILNRLKNGRLVAFDKDPDAHQNLIQDSKLELIKSDFKFIETMLREKAIEGVDGILADLGVSSHQLDTPERGFSFRFDEQLDMRMDRAQELTAWEVVNNYSVAQLAKILGAYGEVKGAMRKAYAIENFRERRSLETALDLQNAIEHLVPAKQRKKVLAQVFQAIRIEVNGEMDGLATFLEAGLKLLNPGGRFVIISYHSLEDRMVKNFFRYGNLQNEDHRDFYGNPLSPLKVITRKVVMPGEEEIQLNPPVTQCKTARRREEIMENRIKPELAEERISSDEPVEVSPKKGLSAGFVDRYLRFIVFLTFVGIVYIWNSHTAEKQVRQLESLKREIRQLKTEFVTLDADLSHGTKHSEIASLVDTLGLEPLRKPPFKLYKKK